MSCIRQNCEIRNKDISSKYTWINVIFMPLWWIGISDWKCRGFCASGLCFEKKICRSYQNIYVISIFYNHQEVPQYYLKSNWYFIHCDCFRFVKTNLPSTFRNWRVAGLLTSLEHNLIDAMQYACCILWFLSSPNRNPMVVDDGLATIWRWDIWKYFDDVGRSLHIMNIPT